MNKNNFYQASDHLIANIWSIPTLMAIGGLLLSFVASSSDTLVHTIFPHLMISFETAKSILSVMTSAIATISSVTLSITVLILSISANRMGPRLLKNFFREIKIQSCLGLFLGSFVYSLVSLIILTWQTYYFTNVVIGVILSILDIFVLIFLLHYISEFMQVRRMIMFLNQQAMHSIDYNLQKKTDQDISIDRLVSNHSFDNQDKSLIYLVHKNCGYIQSLDYQQCFEIAIQHQLQIEILYRPGHYIWQDLPIMKIWHNFELKDSFGEEIKPALLDCLVLGHERSVIQDIEYQFEQLAEIGIHALSPSICSPYTAIDCLQRIFQALTFMTNYLPPKQAYYDDRNVLRLKVNETTFESIINNAFDRFRQQAKDDLSVSIAILKGIHKMLQIKDAESIHSYLIKQGEAVYELCQPFCQSDIDARQLDYYYHQIKQFNAD